MVKNPVLQERMKLMLRRLLSRAVRQFAAGYIIVGIPTDNAPRIVSNLQNQSDIYDVLEFLVKDYRTGKVDHGTFNPESEED
jgi:hypothetical protein